jgi:hypothetical protein
MLHKKMPYTNHGKGKTSTFGFPSAIDPNRGGWVNFVLSQQNCISHQLPRLCSSHFTPNNFSNYTQFINGL